MEDIIREFIDWAREKSPDAWWVYENTEEAIEQFMKEWRESE